MMGKVVPANTVKNGQASRLQTKRLINNKEDVVNYSYSAELDLHTSWNEGAPYRRIVRRSLEKRNNAEKRAARCRQGRPYASHAVTQLLRQFG